MTPETPKSIKTPLPPPLPPELPETPELPKKPLGYLWWNIYGWSIVGISSLSTIPIFNRFIQNKATKETFLFATSVIIINAILGYFIVRKKSPSAFATSSLLSLNPIIIIINFFYLKNRWKELIPKKFWIKTTLALLLITSLGILRFKLPKPIETEFLSFTPKSNWVPRKIPKGVLAKYGNNSGETITISVFPEYIDPLEGTTELLYALKKIDPKLSITTLDNTGYNEWTILETEYTVDKRKIFQRIALHFGKKGAVEICICNIDQKTSTLKSTTDYVLNTLKIAN